MRALRAPPALALGAAPVTTTTGQAICGDNSTHFLPFPDSLTPFTPPDVDDACFRPGYLYGDGADDDGECSSPPPRAPLLAVHAPRSVLDKGTLQGWWDALSYTDLDASAPSSAPDLVATSGNKPYPTALACSQACTGDCRGFSFTHGICLLRGSTVRPLPGGAGYSPTTSCRAANAAVRTDALAGPPQGGKCVRLTRTIPQPAGAWFDKCDVPRCTTTEDVEEGKWYDWGLDAPFASGTRDYAYYPKDGKCYFPVYNHSEIRALLGGEGAVGGNGNEAWVVLGGGSNSFGMGGAVMKAVHNTGSDDDGKDGKGISQPESLNMNAWQTNCLVDTIRHLDGTSTIRILKKNSCPGGSWTADTNDWSPEARKETQKYFAETEKLFTPGSIRVTHLGIFSFTGFKSMLEVVGTNSGTNPWKRYMFWSHSIQRGRPATDKLLDDMVKAEVCNRPGKTLCVVGTKYSRNEEEVAAMKKVTYPNSPVHLMDTAWMAKNNYEFRGGHGLQSLHL